MNSKEKSALENPIIILGFGRSGTTWISDIISKTLGGLILFEPLHPAVYDNAKGACYHNGSKADIVTDVLNHLDACLLGDIKDKWLLRNHISSSLEKVSQLYVDNIQEHCEVIGFKAIRGNFMIPKLVERYDAKIVYVKRNPIAVASSLINRSRFWEEFGFDFHEDKFIKETLSGNYNFFDEEEMIALYKSLDKQYLKNTFIWALSNRIVERELTQLGLPIFDYEDFYTKPYLTTKKLCDYLGRPDISLHPSYLFTPSMLTLKTFHEYSTEDNLASNDNLRVFWEKNFKLEQEKEITDLVKKIENV